MSFFSQDKFSILEIFHLQQQNKQTKPYPTRWRGMFHLFLQK